MLIADYFRDDLDAIISDLPIAISHKGRIFTAARTAFRRENDLGDGGFMRTLAMSLTAPYNETTQLVELGDTVTIDGSKFRVISAELSQDAVSVDFVLEDINK